MISEIKIHESFSQGQFNISGFSKTFTPDRNNNGGGIILFVREGIQTKLTFSENLPIEVFYVEINLKKQKWLIS